MSSLRYTEPMLWMYERQIPLAEEGEKWKKWKLCLMVGLEVHLQVQITKSPLAHDTWIGALGIHCHFTRLLQEVKRW